MSEIIRRIKKGESFGAQVIVNGLIVCRDYFTGYSIEEDEEVIGVSVADHTLYITNEANVKNGYEDGEYLLEYPTYEIELIF